MLPSEVLCTLRQGVFLAAAVEPSCSDRRAWVCVQAYIPGSKTYEATRYALNNPSPASFLVRRIECTGYGPSDETCPAAFAEDALKHGVSSFQPGHFFPYGPEVLAEFRGTPRIVVDETYDAAGEEELEAKLAEWHCAPFSLRFTDRAGYPLPRIAVEPVKPVVRRKVALPQLGFGRIWPGEKVRPKSLIRIELGPSRHVVDLQEGLLRRFEYAASLLSADVSVDWDAQRSSLAACEDWSELEAWAERFKSLDDDCTLLASHVISLCARGGASLILNVSLGTPTEQANGVAQTQNAAPVSTVAPDDTRRVFDEVTEWASDALLAWAPWVPQVDTGLFELVSDGAIDDQAQFGIGWEFIHEQTQGRDGYALALEPYLGCVHVVPFSDDYYILGYLKAFAFDDMLVLPLAPSTGGWVLSYFHHHHLQVGRLVGTWLNRANITIE